ncbi:ABC transporter substrate-binding protein [Klebsiella pneumoniae]|uniref:ABC transporter substrate-binding protein n=1 Tax=Klebsiella pneumoniae TaxID=573 RepID=UPI0012DCA86E|nr:ABC transporter substrate-binding protein [Klebsiella pneumoniae]
MTIITKKRLIAAGVLSALIAGNMAMAADVPAGVQLAEKQTLVRNSGAEPQSLDPNKIEGVPEANISRDLFEGLLNTSPKDGHPIPGVAESWDNKDFKVWTFHLRKDAKWSNGEPVTAQDFVYSWQRLVDPKTASPYASYPQYGHIVNVDEIIDGKKAPSELGVKAIDDHTLEVTLSEPVPYFYKLLVNPAMSPVYKPAIEKFGEKWTQPGNIVTNGAYTLKDWVVNERIVMERNPHYWDNAKTVINTVTWLPTSSEVTYVNRYRSGELDMTYNQLPIELFQKLKKEIPNELHVDPYLCTYYYENLLYNTSDLHKKLAIAAASLWRKNLGIDVKLVNQEWKTFLDTRHQGTYDVARAGWCADYNEPTSFLNTMLSDSSMNTAHYKSPAFDKIMAESVKASDEAQRTAAYAKAEQQLDKDSAIVPVYYYVNARLVKPWVGGYTGKDPMDNVYTKDLYVIKH